MGCDIHLRAEAQDLTGAWREVLAGPLGPDWAWDGDYTRTPACSQNYLLFARLAGVRMRARYDVEALFADRGAPEGELLWGEGLHSHTWATLAELLAADWGVEVYEEYVAAPDQYRRWRDDHGVAVVEEYNDGCGDGFVQPPYEVITEAEYTAGEQAEGVEARAEFTRKMLNGRTLVSWKASFRPLLRCGFVRWVNGPHAAALAEAAGGAERVRLLIAFDS